MQKFYFDINGWFSTQPIEGRETEIAPPDSSLAEGFAWNFTGYAWQAQELSPKPQELPPAPKAPRRVSVGAFFDRFGVEKWGILADPAPAVQALVKDCSVRAFIDLDRPDLPQALGLLTQAGHAIDAAAILAGEVQPSEVP